MSDAVEDARQVSKVLRLCGKEQTAKEVDRLADEITSLRTELAATPQWRDKPTIPGVYFSSIRGVETLKQWDIDDWPNRYIKVRIFGPIPTDTSKETGE